MNHATKHACRGKSPDRFDYGSADMDELGRHCSWTERRAEEAGRDVEEQLKCQVMQRHIGEEVEGLVTGVASSGLFVELAGPAVSGPVHVTDLPPCHCSC